MIKIDMWYRDNHRQAVKIDINFYDKDSKYRGNIYINGKILGDYVSDNSVELEKNFSQLTFNWN